MQASAYGAASFNSPGPKVPHRFRLNWMAMLQAAVVPCALFVWVRWLMTSSMHYEHTMMALALVGACLLVPAGLWVRVWQQRQDKGDLSHREPNWFTFMASTSLAAWVFAVALGMYTWTSLVQPYYEISELAMIRNVSTRESNAGQYIDVGAIEFVKGTDVVERMAMGYKDGNLYCVAPILTFVENSSAPATYDFWAVGVNCCDPFEPRVFTCGEPTSEETAGGFRLLDSSKVPYYHKAVQMAQEEFKITAGKKQLFLQWAPDPIERVMQRQTDANSNLHSECRLFLVLLMGLVLLEAARQKYTQTQQVPI
eukprot:TRINITY_DN48107_c0_g1_i1.p1 TRINITY_DN48107_c0_g1~~TRINITY_DN48107_c0_g1_i1.p1  ORF type:complete len:311 (+),score=50.57 TRINITY_DN48107_c0_g1_i1:127-1059(+)